MSMADQVAACHAMYDITCHSMTGLVRGIPPRQAGTVGGRAGWLAGGKRCGQTGEGWQGRRLVEGKAGAMLGGMCLVSCHCIACYAIHTIHTAT